MPIDLLQSPRWNADHLGLAIPDSPHAVSVCLPRWQDNIAYEEGDPATIAMLQAAYPRFCLHPLVRKLGERVFATTSDVGLVFASRKCAERAAAYAVSRGARNAQMELLPGQQACGVQVGTDDYSKLREYWQHAGENISSRAAEQILNGQTVRCTSTETRDTVRDRVAACLDVTSAEVQLHLSGMSAMAAVYRAVRRIDDSGVSVQFGFPYVDTLKILERFPPGTHHFFPEGGADDLAALAERASTQKIAAVFCETPTNPLLRCPDLHALRRLADQHQFLLVVDDTLAACLNLDVMGCADVVVTSLTKYFSGYGDVIAGSSVINPDGRCSTELRTALTTDFEELLCDEDLSVLAANSTNFQSRVHCMNDNAKELAARLAQHPAVAHVFHPSIGPDPHYELLRKDTGGYGGLLSIVLKHPERTAPGVFDRLTVCKGPNLGTNFTLCCPFTILAHYHELDEVERHGVSRWLMRVSVGIEPIEELWQRFDAALNWARQ
jgi:cystathionine gamma-synthase